jgi:hypothetical protein
MFIDRQQILNTLNILAAKHQKKLDEFNATGNSYLVSTDEAIDTLNSVNALSIYNSFKQKYQTVCLNKRKINYV